MVRAVFNEVIELKSSVLRLDERFAIQFSPAPSNENVTSSCAFATAAVSQGIDFVAKEREMARVNAHPDSFGAQSIIYKCNKKWVANLLIQNTIKGRRQRKRRRVRVGVSPVVEAQVVELEAPTAARNTRLKCYTSITSITKKLRHKSVTLAITESAYCQLKIEHLMVPSRILLLTSDHIIGLYYLE
ncbi:uncharacterized protein EV154DRAFT_549182 [Mucor mucedo]|uniref:uncharacterized protein n=1 Tax=Mucor mucedo TaxID=29922 RepID=UPI002220333E|nr:uncharacterized protein EV154DRAFT_549182 [Mucor mucedo]KAI7894496.1 hypothetical protein EV154DRAFT_549182 [Mucor mucedo]